MYGIMEEWKNGMMEEKNGRIQYSNIPNIPLFHSSILPLFHY